MSAPRVIYLLSPYPFPVDFGNGAWSYGKNTPTDIAYILKSDFDALQTKLTAAQEKLAKIYATEPDSYMKEDFEGCLYECESYADGAIPFIPKPQEPT